MTTTDAATTSAIALRLELLGLPVPAPVKQSEADRLMSPILARQRELSRRLAHRPCAADQRIQTFLDSYLEGAAVTPRLPRSTFVLDQPGLARALSLPEDATSFTSDYVESYRVLGGVLHNPRNDRRTTAGVFHVAEGGLPIPDDKIAVPRDVFARLLAHAVEAPEDLLTLPWASRQEDPARCFVSLLLRPVVVPEVPGFSAERSDKVKWVEFLTKDDGSLEDPSINSVKVADWVNALAAKTDVKPENRVDNVDSSGNVLTVAREGKKGLKTNNTEQITKDVVAAMTDGKAYEGLFHYDDVEPGSETKQVAEGTENLVYQAAEGEKWVDVNLTDNSVTAYVGGKVAGGPFYMVPGAPETPTIVGTFHVYLKYDVQTMRGENADGTKYETEGVPWVTYFTGSYAMHGAPWRSSFGWSGYGGSHGCVNMPVDAAKFIYDWTDMGDTVVVHY